MFGSPETRSTGSPEMMQCLTTVSEKSTARALMASPPLVLAGDACMCAEWWCMCGEVCAAWRRPDGCVPSGAAAY
jgi:hypothetical protein